MCGTGPLTIPVDGLCICRTRCPRLDIGRRDEDGILEGSSRDGDFFDIFQRRPRGVTFATGRTDDTFVFLTILGRDCNSGALNGFEESMRDHNNNHGVAYDQTGE